jgi:peptide chain release factor 1
VKSKVAELLKRLEKVEEELARPDIFEDAKRYKELSRDHSYLNEVRETDIVLSEVTRQIDQDRLLLKEETDPEMVALVKEELLSLEEKQKKLELAMEMLLVPPDPNDDRSIIMELRAGTGGDEAAIFVGECVRMYQLYADEKGWNYEVLSTSESEVGGYKEYIMVLSGPKVKRFLEHEAGTHRVQRVPVTETQGRVHTSAITIAVLLEPTEEEDIDLEEKELRIDTYRSSGAGGQHVNTTDSAVRITHLPTGIVVYCQDERSQHKNRDKAMRHLKAKIAEVRREEREKAESAIRSEQVGTGDRSGRIRTYNFPQNRVTDHRINLTLYQLDHIMQGDLDSILQPVVNFYYQKKLSAA